MNEEFLVNIFLKKENLALTVIFNLDLGRTLLSKMTIEERNVMLKPGVTSHWQTINQ